MRLEAAGVESLHRFYSSLPTATLVSEDVLRLPEGVSWFDDSSVGPSMYVRDCYRGLYDTLATRSHAVLLGTPGIGKSTAALYFIWRLLHDTSRRPRVIIYRPQLLRNKCVIFERDGGVKIMSVTSIDALPVVSEHVLEIYDGVKPEDIYPARRILVISSPRKDVWGDFQKQMAAARLYMPTFSLSELLRCREIAYPTLSAGGVELLQERWGGSARFALRFAPRDAQTGLLSDAANAAKNSDLSAATAAVADADGGTDKYGASPHILFHLAVSPGFNACRVIFASDFCRDLVLSHVVAKGKQAVSDFIAASEGTPGCGSLRGHLFERFALSALFSQAREWEMHALDGSGSLASILLHERPSFIFATIPELLQAWERTPEAVGRPRNSNWPTWDAVTRDDDSSCVTFWQLTVSSPSAHGLKGTGLVVAKPLVPDGYSARFVFVVLPRAGLALPSDAVRITGEVPAWAQDMPQFVLPVTLEDDIVALTKADAAAAIAQVEEPELAAAGGRVQQQLGPYKRRRIE